MALFTLCATTPDVTAKPCAIVEASSVNEALKLGEKMRKNGDLVFLPRVLHMTARRSSRLEITKYTEAMVVKPDDTERVGADPGYSHRARRRELAFFQRLWRNTRPVDPRKSQASTAEVAEDSKIKELDDTHEDESPDIDDINPVQDGGKGWSEESIGSWEDDGHEADF